MSSEVAGLKSATFHEEGYDHVVELVHQRDARAHRALISLEVEVRDASGGVLASIPVDPREEILDLERLVRTHASGRGPVMVTFDARYDPRVFPYRPHHYAYLHRRGSEAAPLYYAINAVLGGVPDRIGATSANNFETYLFLQRSVAERYSLLLGNVSRWAPAEVRVFGYYGRSRRSWGVKLGPGEHAEFPLPGEQDRVRLQRVEVKTLFRLATYVVGRRLDSGELVLLDHLFSYFK
jgi:hypothetical protein